MTRNAAGPRAFRAVLWDLDGTLLDSYEAIHEALGAVLKELGKEPITMAETRRSVGNGLDALLARFVGDAERAEATRIFRERYDVTGPELTTLMPGADHVTRELVKRDVLQGVASNKPSDYSEELLEVLEVRDRFEVVVGPDLGFPPKPAPDMVLAALEEMDVEPEEALFVGDMVVDVKTARAAGLAVAVVPIGSSTREELIHANPDYLFSSLVELLSLFPSGA